MKLNKEELIIGGIFGGLLAIFIGPWAVLTALLCSFLWAWTGAGNGAIWRKVGCPLVACGSIFLVHHHWQVWVGFIPMVIVLSLGYGIPSTQPPDAGSPLGRFWYKISPKYANVLTRGTIYTLLLLCFIPAFL